MGRRTRSRGAASGILDRVAYGDARVRHVGGARRAAGGDYVLYWMQAYRRLESNHALDEALRQGHLNNRYALDGRDPNSWTGILWCFGLFDHPWAPERPVLGTVRCMSSENTARKFRLGPYLDWVASLPPPPAEERRGQGSGASGG